MKDSSTPAPGGTAGTAEDAASSRHHVTSFSNRAGMKEVANRAGVAMSSVSRVLSGHRDVSDAMRERVMAAVDELGYEPNMLAGSLRRGATQTVGFVVGDISNPLLAQIALGAETALYEAGYAMLLTNSLNDPNLDAEHIRLLQQRRVDGLLLSVADEINEDTVAALQRAPIPAVLIDRTIPRYPHASSVFSNHGAGITAAAEHLVGLGHRRIALVAGSPHARPTRERVSAVEEVAEAHPGVVCQSRPGAFTRDHGAAVTAELLDGRRPPTAIIAGGNQILAGVLQILRERRLRIPRDVSLVTCDDVALAEFLTPALATIRRDSSAMGDAAARLLLKRLGGGEPETVVLPTDFVPAASCGKPPITESERSA